MESISSGTGDHVPLSPAQSISSAKSRSHTPSLPSYTSIAIWSRRPGDPSKAPGIIISPRAQPPEDIMSKALDMPTPPASPPKPVPMALPSDNYVQEEKEYKTDPIVNILANSTISSSAVTEVTDVPTLPGSPMSTNTSVSGAGGPLTKEHIAFIPAHEAALGDKTTPEAAASIIAEPPTAAAESTATNIGTPPAKPSTPKSWASLFSSASTSSTGASATSLSQRTGLPTSSVVGFSIPASTTNPPILPIVPVIPAKKSELLNLLTHGPRGGGMDKIRTRGLINSGNMCFANAVLQVLVYCAPFQRLFIELGKMLVSQGQQQTSTPSASTVPPAGSSSSSSVAIIPNGSARSQMNGTTMPKSGKSQTPFVDATVEFLQEFMVEEEGEGFNFGKKAKKNKDGFSNQINGRSGGAKGKEKEIVEVDGAEGNGTDGDDWPDSFLPSYVYEAMKEKKRFESMRSGQQEDAEEFLGFYLDTLEEELLSIQNSLAPPPPKTSKQQQQQPHRVEEKEELETPEDGWLEVGKKNRMIITRTIKAVESPITRMFGGKFKSTLKAPGQKDSVLIEDWRSLRLDIQPDSIHTIQEALKQITHPQSIQMTHPSGITIEANLKVLIETLPPVLVLHVKRFRYENAVDGVVKIMKQVRFEPELEIGSDVVVPGKRPTKYRLFGAIYHHGPSATGGHYTLDILHQNRYPGAKLREGWVRIDDELFSDVRSEDVFDAWEKDEMRNAYLLFYKRIRS